MSHTVDQQLGEQCFALHHGVKVTHTTKIFFCKPKIANAAGGVDGGQLVQKVQAQGLSPIAESIQSRLIVQTCC